VTDIVIVPMGEMDHQCLEFLFKQLSRIFSVKIGLGEYQTIRLDSYHPIRKQYDADQLLAQLGQRDDRRSTVVVGIIDVDLYV
jgi:predicted Zn-dependent protease